MDDIGREMRDELVEHVPVTKELGNVDEEIFVYLSSLVCMLGEIRAVVLEAVETKLREAPRQTALDRRALVARKVDPARFAELIEDALETGCRSLCRRDGARLELGDHAQLLADFRWCKHDLGDTSGDRAARHVV